MQATSPCSNANGELFAGRYRLLHTLGSGGFGTVYAAYDLSLQAQVAIKVLKTASVSGLAIKRLMREAQSLSRLDHPNIVAAHHVGVTERRQPFIVMELIQGESLRQLLDRDGALQCSAATKICIQLAEALRHAHNAGVVHRDVKPENVLVGKDGSAFLVDFGVSLMAQSDLTRLTHSGVAVGTVEYMSPECVDGHADERSDIYSLGCIYFEMLTGVSAFSRESVLSTIWAHANESTPRLSLPAIDCIVQTSTAKMASERYQTCAEMLSDLNAVDSHRYKQEVCIRPEKNSSSQRFQYGAQEFGLMHVAIASLLALAAFFCFTTVHKRSFQTTSFSLHAQKLYEVMAVYTERYDKATNHRNVPFTPEETAVLHRITALLNCDRDQASSADLKYFAVQMVRYRQTMKNSWQVNPQVLRTLSRLMIDGTELMGTERGPEHSSVAMSSVWALGLFHLRRDGDAFDHLMVEAEKLLQLRDRQTMEMLPKYYALRALRALDKHDWHKAVVWKQRSDRLKQGAYDPEVQAVFDELDRRIAGHQSGKPQRH